MHFLFKKINKKSHILYRNFHLKIGNKNQNFFKKKVFKKLIVLSNLN